MTDNIASEPVAGWVCYDGACPFCLSWLQRVERPLLRRGFSFVPLQTAWVKARLRLPEAELLSEMRLLLPDQSVLGGADAAALLAKYIWWLWPLWIASKIPGTMIPLRAGYRFMAQNRYCYGDNCQIPKRTSQLDWLPLLLLPLATVLFRDHLPNWIFMWLFVTAMFAGCKWLTWRHVRVGGDKVSLTRTLGYLFAWPGMNANTFLNDGNGQMPKLSDWLLGFGRFLGGAFLVWLAAKGILTAHPITNGWLAMFGLTLILHFGLFHLLALAWQRVGVPARPLMRSPATATSLADFWSARWNTAFNKLVSDLAFRPMARRIGINWATLGVFAVSGIVHELSISFPARGGYGLPLAYFLLQGTGVLLERSRIGRSLALSHGLRGWLFMLLFTATPAYWLFHPIFVQNVILPMLQTIGAI